MWCCVPSARVELAASELSARRPYHAGHDGLAEEEGFEPAPVLPDRISSAAPYAFGAFPVVVGAADRVGQGRERGEEESAFRLPVAAPGWVFTADAAAGAAGDGRQAGVGGQMAWAGERGAVADFEQDPRGGPDADAGHRGQDLGKRVRIKHPVHLGGDLVALCEHVAQTVSQPGQDVSAAAVPATTTVCSSSAVMTCSMRRSPMRGAFLLAITVSLRRPALRSPAGPPQRDSNSRTA